MNQSLDVAQHKTDFLHLEKAEVKRVANKFARQIRAREFAAGMLANASLTDLDFFLEVEHRFSVFEGSESAAAGQALARFAYKLACDFEDELDRLFYADDESDAGN